MTSWLCTLMPLSSRQGVKSPEGETPLRREPESSAGWSVLLRDLFPESESALLNGLAGVGDCKILSYAAANDFILVSTDSDFEGLLRHIPDAKVVILRSCDYPTDIAAEVLRRNAIRLAELEKSVNHLIVLDE